MTFVVNCINKDDRLNPYERITYIGGNGWRYSQKEVIRRIKAGYRFLVKRNGLNTELMVAISPYGNEYVKTKSDNTHSNNLLNLMECYY